MPADRSSTGQLGEDAAAGYLSRRGCEIITRNWRANPGEVDIIAECTQRAGGEKTLAFIEVRTRHGERGTAEESISPRKAANMTSAAYAYMAAHGLDPETTPWRIDLVAIAMRGPNIVAIDWIQNALEG
ncbi:MAG: YraN family protein [Chloroflexota bacterium]